MAVPSFDQGDIDRNRSLSILIAVIPVLFFLPLVDENNKNSPFLRFSANQGLLLILTCFASGIGGSIVGIIPILGWIMAALLGIGTSVLYVIGIINAVQGNGKGYPFLNEISIIS